MTTSKNSNLIELFKLLEEAEQLIATFSGGYSNQFDSAQQFHKALSDSILKLRNGDNDQLTNLSLWFAPTCDWDDFTHKEGTYLANRISPLVTALIKSLNVYSIYDLITDYQQTVQRVMDTFKKEYRRTDLFTAWRADNLFPQTGHIKKHQIKHYAFHGIGLTVIFDDDTSIDFDFAFFPEQRHDGFDLWRLSDFVSTRPVKYGKYLDNRKLETDFNELVKKRVIIKPVLTSSTDLYFFKQSIVMQDIKKLKLENPWWKFWK